MHHRGHRRKRMEHAAHRLGAPLLVDRVPDALVVLDESFPVMAGGMMRRVPAMIAEVVNDHVVAIEQPPPERKVAVDRKPVAMTEHKARAARDAMAAQPDNRAILHDC